MNKYILSITVLAILFLAACSEKPIDVEEERNHSSTQKIIEDEKPKQKNEKETINKKDNKEKKPEKSADNKPEEPEPRKDNEKKEKKKDTGQAYIIEKTTGEFTSAVPLNVRLEPALDGQQVTIIHPGDKAVAIGKTHNKEENLIWYKVQVNGKEGWTSYKYLIDYSEHIEHSNETNENSESEKNVESKSTEKKNSTKEKKAPELEPVPLSKLESEVINLVNQERAKVGAPALETDIPLSAVAREKSRDMASVGYFDHHSPTYGSPFQMMKTYGIKFSYAGENIAYGQISAEQVVEEWMESPGHKENILNSNFTHIGVGFVEKGNHWTQMFVRY